MGERERDEGGGRKGGNEGGGDREEGGIEKQLVGATEELEETNGGRYDHIAFTECMHSNDYEMERWLRVLAGLPDDQRSIPRTHIGRFITACNSSSKEPNALI